MKKNRVLSFGDGWKNLKQGALWYRGDTIAAEQREDQGTLVVERIIFKAFISAANV